MNLRAPALGACLALCAAALVLAQAPAKIDLSAKAVVAAASAYVEAYNPKMQNVLADEIATQQVTRHNAVGVETRVTKADLFVTFLPAEQVWIAVRDVREVDGLPVNDPDNVRTLIDRAPLSRLGTVIAQKNARFNIGNISRTFNEPTLALLIMTSKHMNRFKFDRVSVTSGASPSVTMSFTEKDRPTLIVGTNGAPVYTSGTMLIDGATGRIEFTRLELKNGSVTARIETWYTDNAKLKLWVPFTMHETYMQTARGFEETDKCETTYSNYRKFETSAIIK